MLFLIVGMAWIVTGSYMGDGRDGTTITCEWWLQTTTTTAPIQQMPTTTGRQHKAHIYTHTQRNN